MKLYQILISLLAGLFLNSALFAAEADNGVSVEKQCQAQYGDNFVAVIKERGVNGWVCVDKAQLSNSVSIQDACNAQRGAGLIAKFKDESDPYSWYCAKPQDGENK